MSRTSRPNTSAPAAASTSTVGRAHAGRGPGDDHALAVVAERSGHGAHHGARPRAAPAGAQRWAVRSAQGAPGSFTAVTGGFEDMVWDADGHFVVDLGFGAAPDGDEFVGSMVVVPEICSPETDHLRVRRR